MKILVLGGTTFLGRHLIELALRAGHDLTTFNRGKRAPELFSGVHKLIGDRSSDLGALHLGEWDVVYDLSGYQPKEVRSTVELLAARIERYVFVSTISVYLNGTVGSIDESARVYQNGAGYGPLKALCEREVLDLLGPTKGVVVRPGLIVGPYDPTYRFNYWLERVARGGAILAPGRPDRCLQIIDVRDLALFMLQLGNLPLANSTLSNLPLGDTTPSSLLPASTVLSNLPPDNFSMSPALATEGTASASQDSIFNTAGLGGSLSMQAVLLAIEAVVREKHGQELDAPVRFVWVRDQELLSRSISEWTELPLWIAEEGESASFYAIDSSKSVRAGLNYRPIKETIEAIYDHHPQLLTPGSKVGFDSDLDDPRLQPTISASLEEAILAELGGGP
jgi:2'-hydroxyisoflavone reductase